MFRCRQHETERAGKIQTVDEIQYFYRDATWQKQVMPKYELAINLKNSGGWKWRWKRYNRFAAEWGKQQMWLPTWTAGLACLLRQEIVVVSFATSVDELLASLRFFVVEPAGIVHSADPYLHRLITRTNCQNRDIYFLNVVTKQHHRFQQFTKDTHLVECTLHHIHPSIQSCCRFPDIRWTWIVRTYRPFDWNSSEREKHHIHL